MILNLATRHGYDIACALRGPDTPNTSLGKCLTTAVIRYLVNPVDDPKYPTDPLLPRFNEKWGKFVVSPEDAITFLTDHPKASKDAITNLPSHQHWHFKAALNWLARRHYNRKTYKAALRYKTAINNLLYS